MNSTYLLAGVMVAVALAASVRLWRHPAASRARRSLLITLQALLAGLLYFTLLPPSLPGQAGTLLVATAGASAQQLQQQAGDVVVALPESPVGDRNERVPDLATALRRHPGMQRLQIVGNGLEPRDLQAATQLPLRFDPPAPLPGWVSVQAPVTVAPGARFTLHARAIGVEGAQAELLDPAGRRVDVATLDTRGDVRLGGTARAAGETLFSLRLIDAQGKTLDALPVPLQVVATAAPRVWVLAGAPGPELKYLRRWASDAGIAMHAQMTIGGGLQLGDAPRTLNATTLAATDLLVLDERSLATLGVAQRAALREAVNNGLGLLVRIGGTPSEGARNLLRGFGLPLHGNNALLQVDLDQQPLDAGMRSARRGARRDDNGLDASTGVPALERIGTDATGAQTVALLSEATGKPLGAWTAARLGRVGMLPLSDSFTWVLAGHDDLHGELWSEVFSTLARPLAADTLPPLLPTQAWASERMSLCALGSNAEVIAADGSRTRLHVDPATGSHACAAYWPQQSGWHRLVQGGQSWPFHVLASNQAQPMRRHLQREATLQLVGATVSNPASSTPTPRPGRRWPWLLGFLACAALLWWLERWRPTPPPTVTPPAGP